MRFFVSLIFLFHSYLAIGHEGHLIFIKNDGQWNDAVQYKADIRQGAIFLEKDRLTVHLRENKSFHFQNNNEFIYRGHVYQIRFDGANLNSKISNKYKTEEYFNYYLGNDQSKWKTNVGGYEEIIYKDLYPNIDLHINSSDYQPKYTFFLRPGAKPGDVKMRFEGLDSIFLDNQGNLISRTSVAEVKDEKPVSFRWKEGVRQDIVSKFILNDKTISFDIGLTSVPEGETIEIDPQIIFSTYSGSSADNFGASATYDFSGNTYGTGLVFGTGYITTTGAFQTSAINPINRISDIAITKFNQVGSARIYSTYIGGSSYDVPHSLVVDDNNRLILLATTSSTNYPVTSGAFQSTLAGGPPLNSTIPISSLNGLGIAYPNGADIVITKFNAAGTALIGSTYFGGNGTDGVGVSTSLVTNYGDGVRGEVMTDTFGNIYIASLSTSTNLPFLSNSAFKTNAGGYDGILVKLNTNLTTMLGFTYYGGSSDDAIYDMCFDQSSNIYATGGTVSSNIPIVTGAFNSSYSGSTDAMILSFNNGLSALRHSTYYGTTSYDQTYFVESDRTNTIYVFGQTNFNANNFYILNAGFSNINRGQFISIFNSTLSTRLKSTTFGSGNQNPDISPTAFLVDYCSKIFVTGWGSNLGGFNTFALSTTGLPVTSNAFQPTTLGNGFYMMILEGDLSAQYYGTYFGGTTAASEEHVDGGTSRFDKNGIVYHAVCAGCQGNNNLPIFPSLTAVAGPTNNSSNCNMAVFKFDFGLPVNADFSSNAVCAPGTVVFNNLSHEVSTNTQWEWSFSNGQTSTVKNPSITFTNPGVYSARLIIKDSASCNYADTITKNVIVLGTAPDTLSTKRICPGSSAKIGFGNLVDPTLTFRWSPKNTLDDTTILSPFASPLVTTTYRVVISKSGCTDTFYQKVIVDTPPLLTINGPTSFCANVIATYTVNKFPTGTYDWFPKNILTSSNRDTARYTFPSFPTTISVNYTTTIGCVGSSSLTVQQGTPTLSLQSDTVVCAGDIVPIVCNKNLSGGSLTIFPSTIPIISIIGDTIRIRVDTSVQVRVIFSVSANCQAADTLNFKLLKDLAKWSIDSVICLNNPVDASVVANSSYNIIWRPSSMLTTTQGSPLASFNLNNADTFVGYTVTHKTKNYCKFSDSASVRFLERAIKLKSDTLVCKDSVVTISTTANIPGNFVWAPSSSLISASGSTARFKVTTSRFFYLTINDNNGCVARDSIFISTANDKIKLKGDSIVCPNSSANLSTDTIAGATYLWLPGPSVISGGNTARAKVQVGQESVFYLHVQTINGCYIIDSFIVKIYDSTRVVKANFQSNTNCNNLAVSFTNLSKAIGTSPQYSWDFAGQGTSNVFNPSFSFATGGLQDVRLIVKDTASCNLSDTIVRKILILSNKSQTLPPIKSCVRDTQQIGLPSMLDPLAFVSWTPNTNMINWTSFAPRVAPIVSTNYRGLISKGGCVDTLFQLVEVDTNNILKLKGDTITCTVGILDFSATKYSVGNYTWFPTGNVVSQNRDSAKMIITQNNLWIKVLLITDFGCRSTDSLLVRTVPMALNLQMDSVGCKDEMLTLTYQKVPDGGFFNFNPSNLVISHNANTAQIKVDTTRLINVEYRLNNICTINKLISIKLLKDAISWNYDSIACRNSTIFATANPSSRFRYVWSPAGLLQTTQGATPARFGNFNVQSKVWLTASIANRPACQFADTGNVFIFEEKVKIKGSPVQCKDSFSILKTENLPGATYRWYPTGLLFNQAGSTATFKVDSSRYFYVEVNYKGCSTIDSFKVSIADDALRITGDSVVCLNDAVVLTASSIQKANYLWSNGMTTNPITVNVPVTTNYRLTITDSNNCMLRSAFLVKTFDTTNYRFNNRVTKNCRFDTLYLEMNYLPKVNYIWSSTPTSTILRGQGTHKIAAWITQSTTFYILGQLTRPAGLSCSLLDSITVQKDTQFIKITGKNLVCRGDTVPFSANFNSSFTYTWSTPSQLSSNGPAANYILRDSLWIYCEATSSVFNLCQYKDSVKADVSRDLDDLKLSADPQRIEYGKTSRLSASAKAIIGYVWSPRSTLDNYLIPSPKAKPLVTTTYTVQVRSPLGCRSADSVVVDVYFEDCKEPEIYLPTGFTPNQDQKNDILYLRGDNIELMRLEIYDRWGQLVFESDVQKKGWDGTFKGAEMEPSVYAYHFWVKCLGGATYSKSGNVTLIK